jgi:hypothetical protein
MQFFYFDAILPNTKEGVFALKKVLVLVDVLVDYGIRCTTIHAAK